MNNDGELALDIAESDEMEEMLQEHIDKAGKWLIREGESFLNPSLIECPDYALARCRLRKYARTRAAS